MVSAATRETLISSGEHLGALHLLGRADYTAEEYVEAVTAAREAGIGEAYASKVVGVDVNSVISGVEQDAGDEVVKAAERRLRAKGVDPAKATYRQYADALVEASA